MFALAHSLPLLSKTLQEGYPVVFERVGAWYQESAVSHLIRILTFQEKSRLEGIRGAFCAAMDSLEYYNDCDQHMYLKTAEIAYEQVWHLDRAWELDYRIYALRRRLGCGEQPQEGHGHEFMAEVCNWKQSRTYSPNGALSLAQAKGVEEVLKYPQFVQMLNKYQPLKDAFLEWTIRDENNPLVFMHYPALTQKMNQKYLGARIGLDNILRLDATSVYLRCETGELDLRNPRAEILLSNGYKVTFDDIARNFTNRYRVFGDIESNATGFFNWSSRHFAQYDAIAKRYKRIDFNASQWWKQLPYESVVTPVEMKYRFQLNEVPDGIKWYYSCVGASESNREVLVKGTHGYTIVSIPNENGTYNQYSFGKFIYDEFPVETKESLALAQKVVYGRIVCPDGTSKDAARDKEYITVGISPDEGVAVLEDIKQDILQGLRREMPFQLFGENCMHWSIEKIRHKLSANQRNIFYVKPFEAKRSTGMLRAALFIYSIIPAWITRTTLNWFSWWFGAYEPLRLKSREGSEYFSTFAEQSPWHPAGYYCANPCVMLLRRRSGLMR
jgi:hypothetical protein